MHFLQVVIRKAKELYEFAESTMKDPHDTSLRVLRLNGVYFLGRRYTAQQKRSVFQISEGKQYVVVRSISTRRLSCYCDACLDFQYDQCGNSLYVDNWEEQELEQEHGHQPSVVTRGDVSDALEGIKQLATKGAIVAIASADRGENYYLLQVTGDRPEVISAEESDDWGTSYPPGAKIIHGYFLIRKRTRHFPYHYQLNLEKKAAVFAATMRFICPELSVSDIHTTPLVYEIPEALHMDILESLHGF